MIWEEHAYLMADPALLGREENTSMVREEACKHDGSPVIHEGLREFFLGQPGYRVWIRCVALDGGRYRMWYAFQPMGKGLATADLGPVFTGYAESDDGIRFQPRRVGTTRHDGSKDNNLVAFARKAGVAAAGMMHDPLDREHPYKCVFTRRAKGTEIDRGHLARYPWRAKESWQFIWGIGRSRDGFEWEMPRHKHNLVEGRLEFPKIHRAMDGGLVIADQGWCNSDPLLDMGWHSGGREVAGWITYDLEMAHCIPGHVFELPEHMTRVHRIYSWPDWDNTQWVQPHVGLQCARKGPTMIGLNGYLYRCWAAETHAQVADIGLCVSPTGTLFREVWPFQPFLRRGNMGEWDCGLVWQCAVAETGDRTLIYYGGSDVGNAAGCHYRAGVGTIGRDRYGYRGLRVGRDYREPKARRGEVILKPCVLPGKPAIAVNATHVTAARTVKIELRDAAGAAIPGFRFKDCLPVTDEGVRRPVRWKGADVRRLARKEVGIAIELVSPDCQFGEQHSPRVYAVYTG